MFMPKVKNVILIAVFSVICVSLIVLSSFFTEDTSYSDEYIKENSVVFTPDNGKPYKISPPYNTDVRLDGTYTITYKFAPIEESTSHTLSFNMGMGEAEILLNDKTIYSGNMTSSENLAGSPDINITLDNTSSKYVITAKIRYTDPQFYISPPILKLHDNELALRRESAIVNSSAISAGISLIGFLIVVALFLISIYFSAPDYSLPFLALGILIFCINRLFFTGAVECPEAIYSLIYEILPYCIAPLILIYIILNRKKRFLKYIFILSGIFAVLIILANVLFFMSNNVPNIIMEFKMFSSMLLSQNFEAVIFLASNYLIIICVASALIYHVRNIINSNAEKAVLENQNRAISQGYDNLVNSVKKTNEVRHEWKHDLLTLSLL